MFQDKLRQLEIDPKTYIDIARKRAEHSGYDPSLLSFSSNPKKKLDYAGRDFGATGYNDYIIYHLKDPKTADKKRKNYWKRAMKVAEATQDKYSPAVLALTILW